MLIAAKKGGRGGSGTDVNWQSPLKILIFFRDVPITYS